ncbi:MAG TPA: hypothetical protein VGI30_02035 [Caulobacteraceae bacterium]|jgi:hypothetical protein
MWKRVAVYGAALAAGALALQWLDYDRLARSRSGEIYTALIAAAFLALGVFLGRLALQQLHASALSQALEIEFQGDCSWL